MRITGEKMRIRGEKMRIRGDNMRIRPIRGALTGRGK